MAALSSVAILVLERYKEREATLNRISDMQEQVEEGYLIDPTIYTRKELAYGS